MNKSTCCGLLACFVAWGWGVGVGVRAETPELEPHDAVYDLSLAASKGSGAGIVDARGRMTYKLSEACDGWIVENNVRLDVVHEDTGVESNLWSLSTWESKDGLSYRYQMRSIVNGKQRSTVGGSASLDGIGKGGYAEFVTPRRLRIALPEGTLFPTQHTKTLLAQARAGARFYKVPVFDGSSLDALSSVNAIIMGAAGAEVQPEIKGASLLQSPSWKASLAFFTQNPETGTLAETPGYEVALRYHDNGVVEDVRQDFGTFKLKARLNKLVALPKPQCR